MNAFKKELAAKLLDDNQSERAMEQVVKDIDGVLSNKTMQANQADNYSAWCSFVSELSMVLVDKLVNRCILEGQEPNEHDEAIMQMIVFLDRAAGSENWECLLGNVNDVFEDRFLKIKSAMHAE